MLKPAALFTIASLAPAPLIAAGALWGGFWAVAAIGLMGVLVFVIDELIAEAAPEALPGVEFPASDRLAATLALTHLALLAVVVFALSGATALSWPASVMVFMAAGLYLGQIANSNAHELIHSTRRGLHGLGVAVYAALGFGHHASAHVLVHHRNVGTDSDPNSAPLGMSFYRYAPRAWIGSFRRGLRIEAERRRGRGGLHPYLRYGAITALAAALAYGLGGITGVAVWAGLSAYAQTQLLLSDYVQHYGLRRAHLADGRLAPVSDRISWNAPLPASSYMMLNAPRHSHHHAHPGDRFPALTVPAPAEAPTLPHSLPLMGAIALIPPLWHRMMDHRAANWAVDAWDDAHPAMAAE
ncbi:alkane 1-monooxygenase [Anianabacter salinae]|uniref:alkane 1-monooxygenase n=1 Tax=Anianabacter salinae TaxID=2851023 RepID=UPI00225E519A|nr:alkane 1-monooxygenase [Anianabacter salinae]MBV0913992.1 alkane 1-monooxygenase [Anianabacter salinae]